MTRQMHHPDKHSPRLPASQSLLLCGLLSFTALAGTKAGASDRLPGVVENDRQCRPAALPDEARQPPPLYEASYEARSHGLSTTAYRELSRDGEDYRLSHGLELSVLGATVIAVEESSHFRWQAPRILPRSYDYQQEGISRRWEVMEFDWEQEQVGIRRRDAEELETGLMDGVLDQLSFQMQLRMDVRHARENGGTIDEFRYRIMDEGEIECHLYRFTGEETLETPAGRFEALKLERVRDDDSPRKTLLWLAPELDYQLARLEQVNGSGRRTELVLESLDLKARDRKDDSRP